MRAKKAKGAALVVGAPTEEVINSIKGFDRDLKCRGFQFEIGKTYEHAGAVIVCQSGFHAIEGHPFDVFGHYPPAGSCYTEAQQSGALSRNDGDSKVASARITIGGELHLHDLVARAVKWVFDRAKPEKGSQATGDYGAASSTGDHGAASSTGDHGAASSTGHQGAASSTGYGGAASSTGNYGAASSTGAGGAASSTGNYGAASSTGAGGAASSTGAGGAASSTGARGAASSTGDFGAASSTGDYGAASSTGEYGAASSTGEYGAASSTGYGGAASSTGNYGAASSTGNYGAASSTGEYGAASSTGVKGRVMGAEGNALFLVYRDPKNGTILHAWAGIVGHDGIKPLVWYLLSDDGKPAEVTP